MRASTFPGFSELCCCVTVLPHVENTCSEGVEVAGMLRKHFTTLGNLVELSFYHKSREVDCGGRLTAM